MEKKRFKKWNQNNDNNLVVLDLMLPKIDGMEVCKTFASNKNNTPILMLTAKDENLIKYMV